MYLKDDVNVSVVLSPRNRERAALLQAQFPDRVSVAASNQEVLDRSDWVALSVLPKQAEAVIKDLRFRPAHKVINLIADKPLPLLREWIGETAWMVHMIPVSFTARREGPIVLYPYNEEILTRLSPLGKFIVTDSLYEAHALAALSAVEASFCTLQNTFAAWAGQHGVKTGVAQRYLTSFFSAVSEHCAGMSVEEFLASSDQMTPGGLNWRVKTGLEEKGTFHHWAEALDLPMEMLEPQTKRD